MTDQEALARKICEERRMLISMKGKVNAYTVLWILADCAITFKLAKELGDTELLRGAEYNLMDITEYFRQRYIP